MTVHRFTSPSFAGAVYLCDRCGSSVPSTDGKAPIRCPICSCVRGECPAPRISGGVRCAAHERQAGAEARREAEFQREIRMATPPIAYDGGPVYDADRDHYHPDLGHYLARFGLDDENREPLLHPCVAERLPSPIGRDELIERFVEAWTEPGRDPVTLPEVLHQAIDLLNRAADRSGPRRWVPDTGRRIIPDDAGSRQSAG